MIGPAAVATTQALEEGAPALFGLLAERIQQTVAPDLLTVLAPDPSGDRLRRLYSSDLEHFPLSGADDVEDSAWFRRLFVQRKPIVANNEKEILSWLPEWQSLIDMGFGSLVNMPLIFAGNAVGLLNLMAGPGHFTSDRLDAIGAECPLAALAVMAAQSEVPTISRDRLADAD